MLFSKTPGSGIASLTKRRLDHFKRLAEQGYDWESEYEELQFRLDNIGKMKIN